MTLEELYHSHNARLVGRLTAYSRDYYTAEDAVQLAFLKAMRNPDFADMPERAAAAWLYMTAKNVLVDDKRKLSRLVALAADYDAPGVEPNADDTLIVQELLHKLSPEQRQLVTLRYMSGLNATEIGQALSIPAVTVRTRLRAVIRQLRDHLHLPN
ncbi:MAG: RNA polymerase sigma factor [Clostridiales bacterium]|jgi:RNA polymerase sigma-70 factor (ECF subfamily)|nr:RNA polymerase sigma factor [Clostridiales bacterium]